MDDNKTQDPTTSQTSVPRTLESPRNCTPWNTAGGRVISLVSRKGGVGKTTSAVNLGAAFALSGHTVLVIGTDPQCGVCRTLGVDQGDLSTSLDEIFTLNTPLTELVQRSPLENLFFASPCITSLADEESFLANMNQRADDFAREVDRARNLYDTILIDCPPSLGAPTRAALLASDSFLVPVQAEELCRGSLSPLMDFVADFRRRHFAAAETETPLLEGLFLTMVNSRTRMSKHVAAQVAEEFGSRLLDTGVPRTTRLSEMALKGKPAVIYARKSAGSRAYFNLADELIRRFTATAVRNDAADVVTDVPTPPAPPTPAGPVSPLDQEYPAAATGPDLAGGLDRLLADLGRTDDISRGPALVREPSQPEMVSLDDLLAEEERECGPAGGRDEDDWAFGIDPDDPLN